MPVAVITGANCGVGLAIARRLLSSDCIPSFSVVLACRNTSKAAGARTLLLEEYPQATVDVVELDTSSVASVKRAAIDIRKRYQRIDMLFCNAGAMAIAGIDVGGIVRGLATQPVAFFESSQALRQARGQVTGDGLGLTFATNVFGHFLLIAQLADAMASDKSSFGNEARVVWTGSATASRQQFRRSDYQHVWGGAAYESSKFIVDQIAEPLDRRLRARGIRCVVAEPGNVCSNFLGSLTVPLLPLLVAAVFYLLRTVAGISRFTITPDCAAVACCHAALAPAVDPRIKYHSRATRLGTSYVEELPLRGCKSTGEFLLSRMDALASTLADQQIDQPTAI